ncbi:PA2169 family four-helix-bundle protein [Arachidicoccus sp.]|uniref:PA2169 family four-helix-bundle protein n=1 Tax=Arachidicoccus sp. TaxID=1872624 RepID=UPI003D22463B
MYTQQYDVFLLRIIEANLDRIEGYKKANSLIKKTSFLTYLFDQRIKQSTAYVERLNNLLEMQGANAIIRKSASGYLYRYWRSIKFYFSKDKNKSILSACINEEENLLRQYEEVLANDAIDFYFPLLRKILERQRDRIIVMRNKLDIYLGKEESFYLNQSKLIPLNEVG